MIALALLALGCGGARVREVRPEVAEEATLGPWAPGPYVAGDPVWLELPQRPLGGCRNGLPELTRAPREDGTIELVLSAVPEGVCPVVMRSGSARLMRVGELDAGRYVVRCGDPECAGHETSFDVLPAGGDVEPLATHWRVRIAVAQAHQPGTCMGMPGPPVDRPDDPLRSLRERDPRLHRQLQRAYPGQSPDALIEAASGIDVVQRSEDDWEYGYTDGRCCHIREMGGHAHVERDGTIRVDEPREHESRDVDC
ncbi:hypothetical protein [Sandaracinus amylolyticus]|uniref:Uncharacterized protein n=1 Tax=Sandaracinus amylolyticus TaxID=927083 RepID=A0A0F6VZG7_9BACT|nr:hypothetical protein [Sandaracinus amylolyticus]AKF03568.1 hypothetical protein DB32_000717 [Sandaracinus amylolyticus]